MEKLALAIRFAAKYREESYDHETANKATPKITRVDFSTLYTLSLRDAVDKAASKVGFDKTATEPIYLLLRAAWNESLGWAEEINQEELT